MGSHRSIPGGPWFLSWFAAVYAVSFAWSAPAAESTRPRPLSNAARETFRTQVLPVFQEFCFDCHGDGAKKGGVTLDFAGEKSGEANSAMADPELWWKVLRNMRGGVMPPPKKSQPSDDQKLRVERWIKEHAFGLDPERPDPGKVTVRRLNRTEYRNTIRDLMGIEFNADAEFPADDSGHGFDNLGEVLTVSPLLLEKYLNAAQSIVSRAVPAASRVPQERRLEGKEFVGGASTNGISRAGGNLALSYYHAVAVTNRSQIRVAGKHQITLEFTANERFVDNQFDYNKCRLQFRIDGAPVHDQEYSRQPGRAYKAEFERELSAGDHEFVLEVTPLTPNEKQVRSLTLRVDGVILKGPLAPEHWVKPKNYERFFGAAVPSEKAERNAYRRTLLESFARKAYRRPVDSATIDRLEGLADSVERQPGETFESGMQQAMTAVLASPRFLFREEAAETDVSGALASVYPKIDEFSLASRLSYFLWTTMPDEALFRLAAEGRLRQEQSKVVQRMLADSKSSAWIRNFVGQWLQARDIESVNIDARQVLAREAPADPDMERRRRRFRQLRDKPDQELTAEEKKELEEIRATFGRNFNRPLRAELTGDLRRAMRSETEKYFEHVVREDRSLLELLDSDYTFLNERLARHYGLTNLAVAGDELKKVTLPPNDPRGGLLTQGTILAVTSNPTRTSPVKRGVFILENILGTPPPPPPANVPALEDATRPGGARPTSLRETLALHREQPLCSSCHDRMDPLGLAFENFNAMGMWRTEERGEAIDATGRLVTAPKEFSGVRELKQILVQRHGVDFYRALTEKLLTFALGRGLEYTDVAAVDAIVDRLIATGGKPSALLTGIIESAPFQRTRRNTRADEASNIDPNESHLQP